MASCKPSPVNIAALLFLLLILFICFEFFVATNPTEKILLFPPIAKVKGRRELRYGSENRGFVYKIPDGKRDTERAIGSMEGSERVDESHAPS
ncbi:hypothetical protein ACLOJK_038305, partial [Asimina triloba]